jgi:hypothetical protein
MKKMKFLKTRGTIARYESLVPVTYRILENTAVAEIREPYPAYYGNFPDRPRSNSLFLFTKKFYTLDEVQEFTCDLKEYLDDLDIDVATAVINFVDSYGYAIRINNFIHYEHIRWLQKCYSGSGVQFQRRVRLGEQASVTIFKLFHLFTIEQDILRDARSADEGYLIIPAPIDREEFPRLMNVIRNNADCGLYDAAQGTLEIGPDNVSMIRIFAENLRTEMLYCIREKYYKLTSSEERVGEGTVLET